jgi:tetratricopeptide (TPR) repeat protein
VKVKPMLGSFELEGIEAIDSFERRALVEHRVPGLAGSYFQDLGTAPNTIVISGTRHGDDAREAFLSGIRDLFNKGEETTFAADITTATDITDVVIEDLDVAEIGGSPDSFRYRITIRKYVKPPEPPAAGLPGLDSDLLDQASSVMDAVNTIDALGSVPNLGDPTPPLKDAVGNVSTATSGVDPAVAGLDEKLGSDPAGPTGDLPTKGSMSGALDGLNGDAASGTGVAGALGAVEDADVAGKTSSLVSTLDSGLSGTIPAEGSAPGAEAVGHLTEAASTVPQDPKTITAPVSDKLDQIRSLVSPDVADGILGGLSGLQNAQSAIPPDPTTLLSSASDQILKVTQGLEAGNVGSLRGWSYAMTLLNGEIGPLLRSGAGPAEDRLIAFLAERSTALRNQLLPGGVGPAASVASALDAAVSGRVAAIRAAASDLNAALERAQGEFAAGHVDSTTDVAAAEDALRRLVTEAGDLAAGVKDAVDDPAANADGLSAALKSLYDEFKTIDVVDLARPRELFDHAYAELRSTIAEVDLGAARAQVEGVLNELGQAVEALDLGRLTQTLDEAEQAIRSTLDSLQGAVLEVVGLVRAALGRVKQALDAVAQALGTFDDQGAFHFTLESEIESLLGQVKSMITDTVEPAVAEFKSAVSGAIGQVTSALEQVQGEIDSVKQQLQSALEGATEQLRAADIGGTMDSLAGELRSALDQLGPIDFDPVVDPVVAEIDDMTGQLKKIDPSSLNDILRAALDVATAVITAIDFPHDITQLLMEEFDKLLEVPKDALDQLQERVDAMIARFDELEPKTILEPVSGLFTPLATALDGLEVDALAAPIEEWHERAKTEVGRVMPAALLQPLVEAYTEMNRSLAAISTATLVESLRSVITQIKGDLQRLEPSALLGQLSSTFDQAKAVLESLAPAKLLAPLVAAFDTVTDAIDAMSPESALAPLTELSATLAEPLDSLTDEDARRAAAAFTPLVGLPEAYDPQKSFQTLGAKTAEVEGLLAGLDLGTLLAGVRTRQAAAAAALGSAGQALAPRIDALDPLRDAGLTQALADLQDVRGRLKDAFASPAPPADLTAGFGEIQADVQGLVPTWVQGTPTAAAIRQALSVVDPAAIADAARELHQQIRDEWTALDPQGLIAELQTPFDRVLQALSTLDPAAIAGRVDDLVQELAPRLDALDLDALAHDALDLEDEFRSIVASLDPRPVIDRLSSIADEVMHVLDELDPRSVLAELQPPLDTAKGILHEFDPASLAEALEPAYAEIKEILAKVDLRVILEPLVDRLDELREALQQALTRTEHAFDAMIAAIPG